MSGADRPSPREEALESILETRLEAEVALISDAAWEKLVAHAWERRAHVGDRREIQREVKRILLEDARRSVEG